ncbi:MAG TPA: protein phosphatase 2C domain-containing protein [Vicinamibacterales bacterium]|nr:protein phosphatase 2C domain-containing protein [Vicinamibacterales bacterium]
MTDTAVVARANRVNAAAASDRGRRRTGNEDRHYVDLDRGILLVVDGVGGHAAGEVAAAIAVDVITQRLERPIGTPAQRVREAIALANNEILRQAERSPAHAGMTCVLTLALLTEEQLTIGHVGDSRLYKLTRGGLRKLTHDHSPIGEREDAQEMSEAEAMKHPRRSEVFRDVGSAFHEPDDRDFIELVEATFEPDAALLLCSDGLSDMLTSATIRRTVRDHAGDPERVVRSLINAANKAGGKDNITVVYVEGTDFAGANAAQGATPEQRSPIGPVRRTRLTWLAVGLLAGLLGGVALSEWLPFDTYLTSRRARTLSVGPASPKPPGDGGPAAAGRYPTIAAAMTASRPGDLIQLEPGEYAEHIILKDGVGLAAREPGTATVVAPSGDLGWATIAVNGRLPTRISGLRLLGRPQAPLSVALHLSGHEVTVDDVTIEGDVLVAVEVASAGSIAVRSSRFFDVQGVPIRVGPGGTPSIRHNVFTRKASPGTEPAIDIADSASPQLTANLFVGYPNAVRWAAGPPDVHRDNFFMRGTHGR